MTNKSISLKIFGKITLYWADISDFGQSAPFGCLMSLVKSTSWLKHILQRLCTPGKSAVVYTNGSFKSKCFGHITNFAKKKCDILIISLPRRLQPPSCQVEPRDLCQRTFQARCGAPPSPPWSPPPPPPATYRGGHTDANSQAVTRSVLVGCIFQIFPVNYANASNQVIITVILSICPDLRLVALRSRLVDLWNSQKLKIEMDGRCSVWYAWELLNSELPVMICVKPSFTHQMCQGFEFVCCFVFVYLFCLEMFWRWFVWNPPLPTSRCAKALKRVERACECGNWIIFSIPPSKKTSWHQQKILLIQ